MKNILVCDSTLGFFRFIKAFFGDKYNVISYYDVEYKFDSLNYDIAFVFINKVEELNNLCIIYENVDVVFYCGKKSYTILIENEFEHIIMLDVQQKKNDLIKSINGHLINNKLV